MQGNLDNFKPCHRVASAKELLRRGFDSSPGHTNDEYEDHDESFDDDPGSPNYVDPDANRYNNEDDPFDFDNYDEEQFIRDRDGERALRHIYGSEEAVTIAHEAVARHRQQALFDENYVPDRDFTPIEKPEDDLYGKGHYGYNALRFAFGDNQSVGVANRTVEEFKKRMAEYDGPNDRPSCCYPGWSRDYALAAVRKSFEYEDRVEPQPDQPPENSDHGGPEPDQSSKDPDPPLSVILERSHVILSEAEGPPAPKPPPRQPTPNTYPGSPADDPPADGPRKRRDPGDIRIPLRNLLSVSVGPLPSFRNRATTRGDRAPRSRSGTHTLPPVVPAEAGTQRGPAGAAGPRPNPHRAKPAGTPTHFHRHADPPPERRNWRGRGRRGLRAVPHPARPCGVAQGDMKAGGTSPHTVFTAQDRQPVSLSRPGMGNPRQTVHQ